MKTFIVKTTKNNIEVEVYSGFIRKEDVKVEKQKFCEMCKEGCVNYGKKFSCPPFSGDFLSLVNKEYKEGIFVLMFLIRLNSINSTEYNKVRIANSVMKSRIDRLMRILESEFKTKFFSTGSCRLCKKCQLILKKPCKHPNKMRYSLESTGVNCNYLSERLFSLPLLWFKDGKAPDYTCVLAGLICNSKDIETIHSRLESLLKVI
jgi:predicted metal-binding protein